MIHGILAEYIVSMMLIAFSDDVEFICSLKPKVSTRIGYNYESFHIFYENLMLLPFKYF